MGYMQLLLFRPFVDKIGPNLTARDTDDSPPDLLPDDVGRRSADHTITALNIEEWSKGGIVSYRGSTEHSSSDGFLPLTIEIAHSNGFDQSLIHQLFHCSPCFL